MVLVVVVWQVNMEIQMEFIPTPHFPRTQKMKEKIEETAKETYIKAQSLLSFLVFALSSWILAIRKRERKAKGQRQKWQA